MCQESHLQANWKASNTMLGDLEKLWSKIKDAPQRREVRPFLKVCADQQTDFKAGWVWDKDGNPEDF